MLVWGLRLTNCQSVKLKCQPKQCVTAFTWQLIECVHQQWDRWAQPHKTLSNVSANTTKEKAMLHAPGWCVWTETLLLSQILVLWEEPWRKHILFKPLPYSLTNHNHQFFQSKSKVKWRLNLIVMSNQIFWWSKICSHQFICDCDYVLNI